MTTRVSVFGTKEWAKKTANCIRGCAHDCLYCYAKCMAIRFGRKTAANWSVEDPVLSQVDHICCGQATKVMFPSTHDITPGSLSVCLQAIEMILNYGHRLLIVSKPHLDCIAAICERFRSYSEKILFRFTIGSANDAVLNFWEPHAPSFDERLMALELAHESGFQTSVSCEPMLDENVERVVKAVLPFVTDAIWIGKANQLRQRLKINGADAEIMRRGNELINSQSDEKIKTLHALLKANPRIKWKESIKKVLMIEISEESGLDE